MTTMVPVYGNDKVGINLHAAGTSLTQAITPTYGANRRCYIALGWYGDPGAMSYVRYNGIDATEIGTLKDGSSLGFMRMYECAIPNPDGGSLNITAAWTNSRTYCLIAFTFANAGAAVNVGQGAALGSNAISSTLNSDDIDTMVMCAMNVNNISGTVYVTPSDTVILMTTAAASGPNGGSGYRDADAANTTMTGTRTGTSDNTVHCWQTFIIEANPFVISGNPIAISPYMML